MKEIKCPKCQNTEFWKVKDGRLKCKNCRYLFKPRINSFNVPEEKLREIISEFILDASIETISKKVQISKYKLIKILTTLRKLMVVDFPEELKKILKIEPVILTKNKRRPIIGIFSYKDRIFAKILTEFKPKEIKNFFEGKKNEPIEEWQKNFGIIYNNKLYRLAPKEDVLASFWEYLKSKLGSRGGIRRDRLPLYLGEYVWKFNYRQESLKKREERLLNLLNSFSKSKKLI